MTHKVGIIGLGIVGRRTLANMTAHDGFEVVAAGISEALVATAAGLFVAILALLFFNYLQVRAGLITATYARSCERFLQALLYLEAAAEPAAASGSSEAPSGKLVPA